MVQYTDRGMHDKWIAYSSCVSTVQYASAYPDRVAMINDALETVDGVTFGLGRLRIVGTVLGMDITLA